MAKTRIDGHILLKRLHRGAASRVYAAHHPDLDLPTAVKVFTRDKTETVARTALKRERFLREARLLNRLDHPRIVRLVDFGYAEAKGGEPYFSMPLMKGDLTDLLGEDVSDAQMINALLLERRPCALPEAEAVRVLGQLLDALAYLHDRGILHLDIGPSNLLWDGENIRLADLGIAVELDGLTSVEAEAVGTFDYMAPEQREEGGRVDRRADVYAVGALAYRMLTGKVPEGFVAPLREVVPSLNPELCALVTACLEPEVTRRPADAATVLRALKPVVSTSAEAKSWSPR